MTLPATARVFSEDDEAAAVDGGGDPALLDTKVLRVVLDGSCFDSLDRRRHLRLARLAGAIEDNLGEKAISAPRC